MTRRVRHHVNPFSVRHGVSFAGFENNNPIVVDIGACRGVFAQQLIEQFPEKNYLLCEIRRPLFLALQQRFKAHKNVAVFDGNAAQNLRSLLLLSLENGVKIEAIYVNFPDPWPKPRHHKRRFITADFLANAAAWIPPETQWIFQTDHQALFQDTVRAVAASPFAVKQLFTASPHGIKTQWEAQKTAEGSPIFRLAFSRKG